MKQISVSDEIYEMIKDKLDKEINIKSISDLEGNYFIVRTYSAGVFFGKLKDKERDEVILDECRRLYYWKTNKGISLSEVAVSGLHDNSKVCCETFSHWCKAIELIPCSKCAVESIKSKVVYEP